MGGKGKWRKNNEDRSRARRRKERKEDGTVKEKEAVVRK
jgi:hypothetical protein